MRETLHPIQVAFLLTTSLLSGCNLNVAREDDAKPSQSEAKASTVPVITVETRNVQETIRLPATLMGFEEACLMAKIEAYVEKVHVNIGDEVAAGDVLVTLNSPEMEQKVDGQKMMLTEARADMDLAAAEVAAAKAHLAEQQAMIDLRGSELASARSLVESGALNVRKRDEAEFAMKSADASMARYESAVKVAEAKQSMAAAHADVNAAQLEQARTMSAYQKIRAPFAGVITKRYVDPGDFVQPAMGSDSMSLLKMANIDTLRAVVHVTMDNAGKVAVGNEVKLRSVDAPDRDFVATISRISGVFDMDSRMMRAEIDLDNKLDEEIGRRPLRAGGYGSATIAVREAELPAVPKSALQTVGDETSVMIVDTDGKCRSTVVTIGLDGDDWVGVASGIAAGDRVVAENPEQVKDGQELAEKQIDLRDSY